MTLGTDTSYERLKGEREKLGISVEELANILDVPAAKVEKWEKKGYERNYIPYAIMQVFKYWDIYAPYAMNKQSRTPGSWVKWILFHNKLTAVELGRMMDVSPGAVSNWRRAETIPIIVEYAIRYILTEKGFTA